MKARKPRDLRGFQVVCRKPHAVVFASSGTYTAHGKIGLDGATFLVVVGLRSMYDGEI